MPPESAIQTHSPTRAFTGQGHFIAMTNYFRHRHFFTSVPDWPGVEQAGIPAF
jgi:hypothetical protein